MVEKGSGNMERGFVYLREQPQWKERAARWFHEKWGISEEAYLESMQTCIGNREAVPQWYLITEGERIIAGCGVIDNDFHERTDLTPNICAVYVEEDFRCRGLAGWLLQTVCTDMAARGIRDVYLLTGHTFFYERYGWDFLCMVQENSGDFARIYHRKCN